MTAVSSPSKFHFVCAVDDLPLGKSRRAIIEGVPIALFHIEEGFFAIEDTCSHQQGSLTYGLLSGAVVACPRHGALFDVRSGEVRSLPAVRGVKSFPVKIEESRIHVGSQPSSEKTPDLLSIR